MPIEQSGSITAGHYAIFAAPNVVKDGGPVPAAQRVLASASQVDFNTTTDFTLSLPSTIQAFQLTGIVVTNASISLTSAIGGFYPQILKGGTPIVAASQAYSALSSSAALLSTTLAAFGSGTRFSRTNLLTWAIYFALTTPQGAAAFADIYLIGIDLTISPPCKDSSH